MYKFAHMHRVVLLLGAQVFGTVLLIFVLINRSKIIEWVGRLIINISPSPHHKHLSRNLGYKINLTV